MPSLLFIAVSLLGFGTFGAAPVPLEAGMPVPTEERSVVEAERLVPFYSQFTDISPPSWKKVGCGIASLAMILEYHAPGSFTSVDTLLEEGIEQGAYLSGAGWTYAGLIGVAEKYGVTGQSYVLSSSKETAYAAFKEAVAKGPAIASVHYTFEPTNPIPHLVVVYYADDDIVRYNDPAEPTGAGVISKEKFLSAWKKRYIELYLVTKA